MATRDEIVSFCDELLAAGGWPDYGPNGLQVPGRDEVATLVSGVSANRELLERAVAAGADMVLVHHGLFWDAQPRALGEPLAERLRVLLGARASLVAYHLPLDAHPEVGNNALLCRALGFEPGSDPFGEVRGRPIGIAGRSGAGLQLAELAGRLAGLLGREPLVFDGGPDRVHSIGVVTGGGAAQVSEAIAMGLDAFVTGEPAEHSLADAREGAINFLAAGHHATETLGVRRLGELVAERFSVEHRFIDVVNPV